jgi:hypothetical protein
VLIVKGTGKRASLEKVSALSHPEVDAASVEPVGFTDRLAEAIFPFGNGDEMDVIVHESAGGIMQAVTLALVMQKLQVFDAVFWREKNPH